MSTLNILRVDASIKGENSVSRKLSDQIVARLSAAHPGAEVVTRDVTTGLAPIDGAWLGAVFTPAEARSPEQAAIAALPDALLAEVRAADVLVIGAPVYNFAIPAQLKIWIDQLARKGETFTYTETGPVGLLTGKRAYIALASDGTKLGSEIDFASGYLRHILGFLGITDVHVVAADAIVFAPEETLKKAQSAIEALPLAA